MAERTRFDDIPQNGVEGCDKHYFSNIEGRYMYLYNMGICYIFVTRFNVCVAFLLSLRKIKMPCLFR